MKQSFDGFDIFCFNSRADQNATIDDTYSEL